MRGPNEYKMSRHMNITEKISIQAFLIDTMFNLFIFIISVLVKSISHFRIRL